MHAEATLSIEAAYYNEKMAIWEPLIEPVEYKDDFKPWQLNVQVKTQIFLFTSVEAAEFYQLWFIIIPVWLLLQHCLGLSFSHHCVTAPVNKQVLSYLSDNMLEHRLLYLASYISDAGQNKTWQIP
jgi:hypothetical protein